MEVVLIALGAFISLTLVSVWFIRGLIRDKDQLRDRMDEAYHESLKENREADAMLDDPDYKRKLLEEDNQG